MAGAANLSLVSGSWGFSESRDQTEWMQVWADGRVLCYPDPNQSSFSVDKIMSAGVVTPNSCSEVVKDPMPGHLIMLARPARFMEKIKRWRLKEENGAAPWRQVAKREKAEAEQPESSHEELVESKKECQGVEEVRGQSPLR